MDTSPLASYELSTEPEAENGHPSRRLSVAVALREVIEDPEGFLIATPGELYDLLVEGAALALIRLPFSFDCCVSVPVTHWRSTDQGRFITELTSDDPYGYRMASKDVWLLLQKALSAQRFCRFNDAVVSVTPQILYYLGNPHAFQCEHDDVTLEPEILEAQIRTDILECPLALSPEGGFIVFVPRDEVASEPSAASIAEPDQPRGKRGPKSFNGWTEIWREMVDVLREANGEPKQAKVLAHEARTRAERRGVKELPSESTIVTRLSQ